VNDQASGGDGKQAQKEEGQMGKDTAAPANKRWVGRRPPADTSDPKLAREKALREAADWGMIGPPRDGPRRRERADPRSGAKTRRSEKDAQKPPRPDVGRRSG